MKIELSQEAIDYIGQNQISQVYIRANAGSCGGSGLVSPLLERGRPRASQYGFDRVEACGLQVYVPRLLQWDKKEIKIGLGTYLGRQGLVIENR